MELHSYYPQLLLDCVVLSIDSRGSDKHALGLFNLSAVSILIHYKSTKDKVVNQFKGVKNSISRIFRA